MTILTDDELKAVRERCAEDDDDILSVSADRRALLRHIDALEKDAGRYRWLRAVNPRGHVSSKAAQGSKFIRMGIGAFSYELPAEAELDAAIDAAKEPTPLPEESP